MAISAEVDLSEFEEIANCRPARCVVARSIAALTTEDPAAFEAAMAARLADNAGWRYGHITLATFLKRRQLGGGDAAVRKHRDGDCCCVRT